MASGRVSQCVSVFVCVLVSVRAASLLEKLEEAQHLNPAHSGYGHAYMRPGYGYNYKRIHPLDAGNPCPEAEKPFPCKKTDTCIPMGYLCDDNIDCEDGYDEDPEVCTAARRPPVADIQTFIESEQRWILPKLFGGRPADLVAHGLAVSPTVDNFAARLSLNQQQTADLRTALQAVSDGNQSDLSKLGMPTSAWAEVSFIFSKLIKSGFLGNQ